MPFYKKLNHRIFAQPNTYRKNSAFTTIARNIVAYRTIKHKVQWWNLLENYKILLFFLITRTGSNAWLKFSENSLLFFYQTCSQINWLNPCLTFFAQQRAAVDASHTYHSWLNQCAAYLYFFINKFFLINKLYSFYAIIQSSRRNLIKNYSIVKYSAAVRNAPLSNVHIKTRKFTKIFSKFKIYKLKKFFFSILFLSKYYILKKKNLFNFSFLLKKKILAPQMPYYLLFYFTKVYFAMANRLNNLYNLAFSRIYTSRDMTFLRWRRVQVSELDPHFTKHQFFANLIILRPATALTKLLCFKQQYEFNRYPIKSNFFFFNLKKKNFVPILAKKFLAINPAPKCAPRAHFFKKFFSDTTITAQKKFICKRFQLSNLSSIEFLIFLFFKPIFLKYFFFTKIDEPFSTLMSNQSLVFLSNFFSKFFFYSTTQKFLQSNLLPAASFNYVFKKRTSRLFNATKFFDKTVVWYHNTIVRFLEHCSGKKIYFQFFPYLMHALNFYEKMQCALWARRVKYYRKVLGPRLFLNESIQIVYLALKLKDPFLLSNWMTAMMYKISFWKYKTFLRYIKYLLRFFFWAIFKELNVKGVKYQLKGKISVAGNARTRTAFHYIGFTSHSTFNNKILYNLNLVRTFTGVLGFKLWIVF